MIPLYGTSSSHCFLYVVRYLAVRGHYLLGRAGCRPVSRRPISPPAHVRYDWAGVTDMCRRRRFDLVGPRHYCTDAPSYLIPILRQWTQGCRQRIRHITSYARLLELPIPRGLWPGVRAHLFLKRKGARGILLRESNEYYSSSSSGHSIKGFSWSTIALTISSTRPVYQMPVFSNTS